jgi:mRNA-degrading endonuclease YafQ of YafQ-DinJ toxin-antitoxin module
MTIAFTPRFQACLRDRTHAELQEVERVCRLTAAAYGRPHLHGGIGLRPLGRRHFECRVGLALRLVFRREGDALLFVFAGSHEQVKRYLRSV